MVRTTGFHPVNASSILAGDEQAIVGWLFLCVIFNKFFLFCLWGIRCGIQAGDLCFSPESFSRRKELRLLLHFFVLEYITALFFDMPLVFDRALSRQNPMFLLMKCFQYGVFCNNPSDGCLSGGEERSPFCFFLSFFPIFEIQVRIVRILWFGLGSGLVFGCLLADTVFYSPFLQKE